MTRSPALVLLIFAAACSEMAPTPSDVLTPVPAKIRGLWFDIAHLPHELQADCRDTATLLRETDDDSDLEFIFECRQPDELWYNVTGKASRHSDDPMLIEFEFENGLVDEAISLKYWIFDADPDFSQWMVVAYPPENWLWVLSRNTTLDEAIVNESLSKLVSAGHFDQAMLDSKLETTEQSYGN